MTSTHFRSRAYHLALSRVRELDRPHIRDIHASPIEVTILFFSLITILVLICYIFYTLIMHCISRYSPTNRASEDVDRTARLERGVGRGARNLAMGFFDGIKKGNREQADGKGFFGKLFGKGDERSGEGRGVFAGLFGDADSGSEERRGLLGHGGDRERIAEWGYGGGFMDGSGSESSGRSIVHRDDCVGECGYSFDRRRSANY